MIVHNFKLWVDRQGNDRGMSFGAKRNIALPLFLRLATAAN
jgi:hypothetical protein